MLKVNSKTNRLLGIALALIMVFVTAISPILGSTTEVYAADGSGEQSQRTIYDVQNDAKGLATDIYNYYAGQPDSWWGENAIYWHAVAMSSYKNSVAGSGENLTNISDTAMQNFVNRNIYDIEHPGNNQQENASSLAKAIISLSCFGYDANDVVSVNKTRISLPEKLKAFNLNELTQGYYTSKAPYIVLALNQGNYNAESLKNQNIDFITQNIDSTYAGGPDIAAMMVQGIAPYYGQNAAVTTACDNFVARMSASQATSGAIGNANSMAVITLALCELGINPATDTRFIKEGKSLMDAFLAQKATGSTPGFMYSGSWNEMATNQSFAALVAAIKVMETGNPFNPFDATGITKKQAVATANSVTEREPATSQTDKNIKVYMTVETPDGVWLPKTAVTVAEGSYVYHAFVKALDNAGFSYVGAKKGYVSEITNANRETLAEFDMGRNSGWMYKVNGKLPTVGLTEWPIYNGDNILWYYTEDWTKDPAAVANAGGEDAIKEFLGGGGGGGEVAQEAATETSAASTSAETTATVTDGKATASVSASDVTKAIEQVAEQAKADTTGKTTEKEVVLEVKSTGNVDAVETTIPANAVNELAKADANVVVKTECGDIEIPADSMDNIATQAAGQGLSITMENKKASEVVAAVGADKIKEETGLEGKALENVSIVEVTIKAGEKTVTSFGGKKISLSLPADNGQVAGKSYKVLAISADGSMELMTGVCVVENGKKVVKVTSTHLTTFVVTGEEVKNPFTDVSANDYFFNPVLWAVENKVTSGKTADTFAPFDGCTRAQMVTFLWRAAGSPWASANAHFSDVPEGAYYAEAVEWAIAAGITKGISETTFNPDGAVTREQLASFIYRYAQSKGQGFTGAWMFLLDYSDASSVSEWADEAMHWCVMNNIVTGMSANMLAPQNPANRAQIVTMLYRYFNL